MEVIHELTLDIQELQQLESQARRVQVKKLLQADIKRVAADIASHQASLDRASLDHASGGAGDSADKMAQPRVLTEKITTYGHDESPKFMKLYVEVKNVGTIPSEQVKVEYTTTSVSLRVFGVNNKNYELTLSPLSEFIVPSDSKHKIKKDQVLLMLKKKEEGKTWSSVTGRVKKDASHPSQPASSEDPSESMMKLLKNMYDEGDDEMKKSIAKAWEESQRKMEP